MGRVTKRGTEIEKANETKLSSADSFLKCPHWPEVGQAATRTLSLHPDCPHGWPAPKGCLLLLSPGHEQGGESSHATET